MKFFPLIFAWCGGLSFIAHAAPLPFTIHPGGSFLVQYQLSTGQSTLPTTLQITGNFIGDVEFTGGVLSRFNFVNGNLAYSDANPEIVISTFPVTAKVRIETRNIVADMQSNSSVGAINTSTGVIVNSGHSILNNRGTIFTRHIVAGVTVQSELRDLAVRPDRNALVGVTTLTSTLLQDYGYKSRFRIDFNHTRNESRTQPAEIINGTLNISENGSFTALGEVTVPSQAYEVWAVTHRGQKPLSFTDRHVATGQPLVMLYAFNSAAGPWSPPVSFNHPNGTVQLNLPAGGLLAPVRLEFSPTLGSEQWGTLTRTGGGSSVFNMGESGPITMNLPSGNAGFVRLSLAE